MATYDELRGLFGDGDFLERVEVALAIIASEILTSDDTAAPYSQDAGAHDKRVKWAATALSNTATEARKLWKLVLGENESVSLATINIATDATILSNCKSAVDGLSEAHDAQQGV